MFPREKFIDTGGRYYTQSLFLELGYQDAALYTLKDVDHEYNGVKYKSIKQFYLNMEDTTEYEFANTYFAGWNHWQKICANKAIREHIDEWRMELELKLRARAVKQMVILAETGSFQASKWLADKGWDMRGAGRPTKLEKEAHKAFNDRMNNEYGADIIRLTGTK